MMRVHEAVEGLEALEDEYDVILSRLNLNYDLRLVSITTEDWLEWEDNLERIVVGLFEKMHPSLTSDLMISRDSDVKDEEMRFIYYSDVGKVEIVFAFNPRTLEIMYKNITANKYEEIYSLLA